MFEVSIEWLVTIMVMVGLLLVLVLWLFYDHRDRLLYAEERDQRAFHCIRCDHLYTGATLTEVAPCPKCGYENSRLKF